MFPDAQIPCHHLRSPFRPFSWGWHYLHWPTVEWMMGDIDLYHATSIYAPPTRSAKVMITVRGIVAEVIPDKLPADRVQSLHTVLMQGVCGADYFSAVSQQTADDMEKVLGIDPARIFVIPHAVDPLFQPPENKEKLQYDLKVSRNLSRPYILFVSAIGIHKNVMGLFNAWLQLYRRGGFNLDLCLVGKPDSAWNVLQQEIERQGVQDRVHHLGWIPPHSQALVDIYGGAACFVLPSFYEGWCSPPVEAMACGTPVIVSNCSSLPETTGGAALLVEPDDGSAIASAIANIIDDEALCANLIAAGLKHASAMNWRRSAQAAHHAYAAISRR
ncbi:MAG: glycosyltransferase family 1 protein [Mariprofundales bacterium]